MIFDLQFNSIIDDTSNMIYKFGLHTGRLIARKFYRDHYIEATICKQSAVKIVLMECKQERYFA